MDYVPGNIIHVMCPPAVRVEIIPDDRENYSGLGRKTVRHPAGMPG